MGGLAESRQWPHGSLSRRIARTAVRFNSHPDATLGYFGKIGQETAGTFKADLQQLVAGEDGRVVGLQRVTGERDGKSLDVRACLLFELKDGKVVDTREHFEDLYAWDEFWS